MAIYEWYQQLREENKRQFMEQRRLTDQWIDSLKPTTEGITRSYDESTEAFARSIEEARSETRRNFEVLIEMIRGLTPKEKARSPGSLEEGVSDSERKNPRSAQEDDRGHQTVHQETLPTQDSQVRSTDNLSDGNSGTGDPTNLWGINRDVEAMEAPIQELNEKPDRLQTQFKFSKVTFDPLNSSKIEVVSQKTDESDEVSPVYHENSGATKRFVSDFWVNLTVIVEIPSAHQVLVEVHTRDVESFWVINAVMGKQRVLDGNVIFDPGIATLCIEVGESTSLLNGDVALLDSNTTDAMLPHYFESSMQGSITVPFDRGKRVFLSGCGHNSMVYWTEKWKPEFSTYYWKALIMSCGVVVDERIRVFDPGGSCDIKDWEINEGRASGMVLSNQFGINSVDGAILFNQFTQACPILMPFGACIRVTDGKSFVFDPGITNSYQISPQRASLEWLIQGLFMIFTATADEESESIAESEFKKVEQVILEHFD